MRRVFLVAVLAALLTGCGQITASAPATTAAPAARAPLRISAIPDQHPEKLQRLYGSVAAYLSAKLGVPVEYVPITDYTASVTAFRVGDLDLVWYGGLTGVQARLQVPDAQAIAQRDIDAQFTSVFIANTRRGISTLADLKGKTFTFGSESSTSGRLMPQYFLQQNGITLNDFAGEPGFSGSHDKTIDLVASGSFDAGALNSQVWKRRVAEGTVDTAVVNVFWTSPPFADYHWVLHPSVAQRYGADFPAKIQQALYDLNADVPEERAILELFGAQKFIPTANENYTAIEQVGREIGLIVAN